MKHWWSFGHKTVHFLQNPEKFISDDTHFLLGHFLDLDVPNDLAQTVSFVFLMFMLAGSRLLDLTHFQVTVLKLYPPQALLDFHFDRPVFHVLQVSVFDSIPFDSFLTVGHLFFEFLNLESGVVEFVVYLLEFFINFF